VSDAQQIQTALEEAVAAREEHAQLTRRLAGSTPHLADLDQRILELRRQLDDETADVERLESFSAARIWSRLKGSHLDDLERETAEREAARYAVAEAEARREVMRRERHAAASSPPSTPSPARRSPPVRPPTTSSAGRRRCSAAPGRGRCGTPSEAAAS
jgi:hypothetical protein